MGKGHKLLLPALPEYIQLYYKAIKVISRWIEAGCLVLILTYLIGSPEAGC